MQMVKDFKVMFTYYRERLARRSHDRKMKDKVHKSLCLYCMAVPSSTDHVIFITAPPGYGSIMPCSAATARHGIPMTREQATDLRRSQTSKAGH